MKALFWNCRGFPWHKGESLNAMIGHANIVFLAETWERETCRIPGIPGHVTHSVYQSHVGKRGQGGVACIYKRHLETMIDVCKIDRHKRYIWIMLKHVMPMYNAGCYILRLRSPLSTLDMK